MISGNRYPSTSKFILLEIEFKSSLNIFFKEFFIQNKMIKLFFFFTIIKLIMIWKWIYFFWPRKWIFFKKLPRVESCNHVSLTLFINTAYHCYKIKLLVERWKLSWFCSKSGTLTAQIRIIWLQCIVTQKERGNIHCRL